MVEQAGIRKGMLYGLLTGVFIACYTVVDGYAVKFVLMPPILLDWSWRPSARSAMCSCSMP